MFSRLRYLFSESTFLVGFSLISIACFYTLFFLGQLLYSADNIPPANYRYHLTVVLISIFTNFPLLLLILLRPSIISNRYVRLLTLIFVLAPAVAGQAAYKEPEISRLATIVALGLGSIFLYDPMTEARFALISYIALVAINIVIAHPLHDAIAYLEPTPLTHGPVNELIFKLSNAVLIGVILHVFNRTRRSQRALLDLQSRQLLEIQKLREEAEAARVRAEERLAEIETLRAREGRMTQQLELTARYESLMRTQYGKPLADFLRALLESLQDDLGFVAGLAYQVKEGIYEVVATFALPQYRGRTFSGGLLETAAAVQKPYLVPLSLEHGLPLPSLAHLRPRYALYLPIYADVAGAGVVAVVEMLFIHAPDTEKVELSGELIPRLGSYLWMQQASLQA